MNDLIQPVIAKPVSQKIPVENMVKYCRDFDGTELRVVDVSDVGFTSPYPANDFPCRQAHALHTVALAIEGRPFIWIEPDSPPVRRGWAAALTEEYYRLGKPYMLPFLPEDQPFDIASGVGVYSGDTAQTIPFIFERHGWDYWMLQNLQDKLSRTRLIQHNYGEYDDAGHMKREYRFPQDAGIIRPETVLFHRDKHQDMIYQARQISGNKFLHSGDLGDIIAALPTIRKLGGGELIITESPSQYSVRQSMRGERFDAIAPLIRAQPYITDIRFEGNVSSFSHHIPASPSNPSKQYLSIAREAGQVAASIGLRSDDKSPEELLSILKTYAIPSASPVLLTAIQNGFIVAPQTGDVTTPYISHNFTKFRADFRDPNESLAHWQSRFLGVKNLNTDPWLTVKPSEMGKGRVIVTRTKRYHNPIFDWKKVVEKYGKRLAFIGMDEEHIELERETGTTIERFIVSDLMEMASIIKGSDLLICNQSAPFWIAIAMGTPIVQEVWPEQPNSVIPRDNARYIRTAEDFAAEFPS